jgi:hypothetical protein
MSPPAADRKNTALPSQSTQAMLPILRRQAMILSTLIAASVAAQVAPAPESKSAPAPAAEKKMACCEMMAKGEGCCCCKDKAAKDPSKDAGTGGSDDSKGHVH